VTPEKKFLLDNYLSDVPLNYSKVMGDLTKSSKDFIYVSDALTMYKKHIEAEIIRSRSFTLTEKELKLLVRFLNDYSNKCWNSGCNDVDEEMWSGWIKEERQEFLKEFYEYNGDPENYNPEFLYLPDYATIDFLAYKLLN